VPTHQCGHPSNLVHHPPQAVHLQFSHSRDTRETRALTSHPEVRHEGCPPRRNLQGVALLLSSRSLLKGLAGISAAVVFTVAGGAAALAEETVIDGDATVPITATGPIAFGDVCLGAHVSTSRLIAAKNTTESPAGNKWGNNALLIASASVTGGATAIVEDDSIQLVQWNTVPANSYALDTAKVTLGVTASTTPSTMSGVLTVTLTGPRQGSGSITRPATVAWTLKAVSCNTAPTISVNDTSLEGNTFGGRTLTFGDIGTAHDAEDSGAPTVTCNPAIGSVLPLGTTTVTCTAKDSGGLTTSDSGVVTVSDTTKPVISGTPGSASLEATSSAGAVHTYSTPTASDVVSGTVAVTCVPASGSTFELGTTTVTCTATDGSANSATSTFQVNVHDETAPVFTQPKDVTAEATSGEGAVVDFPTPSAEDTVSGIIPGVCDATSGDRFPLGDTTVTCTATDAADNKGTTSFVVHVVDTTAPELKVPSAITEEATSPDGASITYGASATDAVDGDPTVTCTPASGSTFGLGETEVTCTASDDSGNSAHKSFTVKVQDTTPPVLQGMPEDLTVEGNTTGGALEAFIAPTATDLVDPTPTVECVPAESAFFELGETEVTCTASDATGNKSTGSFTVTVTDTAPPKLSNVPSDDVVEGNTTGGANWSFPSPTATDVVDASPTVECTPAATGSFFPLGKTTVTCTASDASHNTSPAASFVVTVKDTTDPEITWTSTAPAPNESGWNSSDVTVTWTCTDIVGVQSPTVTAVVSDEGAGQSAEGTCTDTSGNTASATEHGINLDKSGPSAGLAVSEGTLGENGWYVTDVVVSTTGVELLSGPATCSADQHLLADSPGTVFHGSCTNQAGLTTVADPLTVKRDTAAPTITDEGPVSEATGDAGWYTSPVTNRFKAADGTSGVATGFGEFTRESGTSEGPAVRISSGPVKDNAGNTAASIDSAAFKIDLSDPTAVTFVGGPSDGASHYFGDVPAAPTCTASDSVSGIRGCTVTGYSTAVGPHTLLATATDNAGRTTIAKRSYTVLGWTAKGFYAPVDMGGVLNSVKGGSTVPLKFELFVGATEQTATSAVKSFTQTKINCDGTALVDDIEFTTTGGTSLRYDTTAGQFVQNWQTPKLPGQCYKVTMTAQDGSSLTASFRLK
jgi:HYR domain